MRTAIWTLWPLLVVALGCEAKAPSVSEPLSEPWQGDGSLVFPRTVSAVTSADELSPTSASACLRMTADATCATLPDECKAGESVAVYCNQECLGNCTIHPATLHPGCTCVGENACHGLEPGGECAGNVLLRCIDDAVIGIDCAAYGELCVEDDETGLIGCGLPGATFECGVLGLGGHCQGDVLSYCKNGLVEWKDCAREEKRCAWHEGADDAEGYFDCR